MDFLAVNIGNTRTKIGAFVGGEFVKSMLSRNDDLEAIATQISECGSELGGDADRCVMVASVVPEVEREVLAIVPQRVEGMRVCRVEHDVKVPIGRQLDRETIIGVDRLLNAAAAYDVLKQTCVVVDAGTALTVDLVDGAGTFHGGAIVPGAQMMLDAMHRDAAQLPELHMTQPDEPVGHSTAQAMLTGVYHGIRGMVRELVEQYAEHTGAFPMVVATGGDAQLLFKDYELVDRVVPDLTLMGMAVTLRVAASAESGDG